MWPPNCVCASKNIVIMRVVVHLCLKGCPYGFFWSHPSSSSSTWNRKKWTPKSQNKQEKILQSLLSSIKSRFFSYITTLHFLKTRGQSQWSYQPYDESDVHNGQSVLKKKYFTLFKNERSMLDEMTRRKVPKLSYIIIPKLKVIFSYFHIVLVLLL